MRAGWTSHNSLPEVIMADKDKGYSEESTSETKTKEHFLTGGPVLDSAREPVKETTTKTEGHEESSDNDGDGGDDD
jgi:hypothetical protein